MSDSTANSTKTILGFDVSAKLSIGDPSSRHTIDISNTLSKVNFVFKNNLFIPLVYLNYMVDAKYISAMAGPFELELEITEKGMESTPRSVLSGNFMSVPGDAPMAMIRNSSSDIVRFPRSDPFIPIDISKTFSAETSVIASGTVSSAIQKAFNAVATGGAKLKLGTLANTTSFDQIVLPRGRLKGHIKQLMSQYGLSDLGIIAYSDFTNFYVHNVNETLQGDSTALTIFYGEPSSDNADSSGNISSGKYYTKYPPKVKTVPKMSQNRYSSSVTAISYPRSGGFNTSTINLKNTAKKMKATNSTDVFNYFDLYKTTTTEMNFAGDSSYPAQGMLANVSTSMYEVTFTITEPFTLTDFIIGRQVDLDSSVSEYIGLEMGGYIDTVSYNLISNANSRWSGMVTLIVKCASNSAAAM